MEELKNEIQEVKNEEIIEKKAKKTKKTKKVKKSVKEKKETKIENKIQEPVDVFDHIARMTEVECLKFGKLDAEIRNAMQGMQISAYRKQDFKREFEAKCRQEDEKIAALNAIVQRLRPEYDSLIDELARKFDIKDKTKMSIDPDTGIVRDIE